MIKLKNISKCFPGVKALDNVNLQLNEGAVHGLVGENGAGKSTLIKTLMGVHAPTEGKILINDKEINIKNSREAQLKFKIGAVFQDSSLISDLTVGENIYLLNLNRFKENGLLNYNILYKNASSILSSLNTNIKPNTKVQKLNIMDQKIVELAKIIANDFNTIIFDETTACFMQKDVEMVFDLIKKLKKKNKNIIFISHRLKEVLEITDVITVLKDGKKVETFQTKNTSQDLLVETMTGKKQENIFPKREIISKTKNFISFKKLSLPNNSINDISFSVKEKEILALVGLRGQGQSKVLRMIYGLIPNIKGSIIFNNEKININSPIDAINKGIVFLSNNYKENLLPTLETWHNLTFSYYALMKRYNLINKNKKNKLVSNLIERLNIKPPDPRMETQYLSGGNKRKVALGKWLPLNPKIFLLNDPTIGLDVGAKEEVYHILKDISSQGCAIILVLSDLLEILNLPDRVLVMYEGKIFKEFHANNLKEDELLHAYFGSEGGEY